MRRQLSRVAMLIGATLVVSAQTPGRLVHVTLHEGTNMAAALSPDGRTLAIDLLGTLWTMPASGGVAKPITDISMDARQPSWSPDGTRIAFASNRLSSYEVFTMNPDGSDVQLVANTDGRATAPQWTRDGNTLLFPICHNIALGVDCQIYAAPAR